MKLRAKVARKELLKESIGMNMRRGFISARCVERNLFSSDTKFDSKSGWPSFTEPVNLEKVELKTDMSYGMKRTEVVCKTCGAHLGHVFDDGPEDKGGKRYCINSVCLELEKKDVE